MQIFLKDFTIIFSKFLHVRNQEIKPNMPKNYGINIFDYEAPRSLILTVVHLGQHLCTSTHFTNVNLIN